MNIKNNIFFRWCYQFVRPKPAYYHIVNAIGVEPAGESPRLIVSLTSFPARIKTVSYTIESILLQKKKANMVVLWLGYDKFPNKEKDLPKRLLRLTKYGLTIKWCKDIRSYTKLIPSLEEFPDDVIVTVDDDVYCLDIEGSSRRRPSDDQVWLKIKDKTGVTNSTSFQQLDENKRKEMFLELKDSGASLRQLERLTGIGKGVIHRIWCAGR